MMKVWYCITRYVQNGQLSTPSAWHMHVIIIFIHTAKIFFTMLRAHLEMAINL